MSLRKDIKTEFKEVAYPDSLVTRNMCGVESGAYMSDDYRHNSGF